MFIQNNNGQKFWTWKRNALLNAINYETDIDKSFYMQRIHLKQNINDQINNRKSIVIKYLDDSKAFIEYLNDMYDIYKYNEENKPNKKQNILIVF